MELGGAGGVGRQGIEEGPQVPLVGTVVGGGTVR